MTLAFQKIRVYARVTLMGAIALLFVLVLVLNWKNRATVWFFHKFEDIPIIWLLLVTGFGAIVAAWVTKGFFRVMSDWGRLRRQAENSKNLKDQQRLADELAEQTKRIDDKLRDKLDAPDDQEPNKD